MVSESILFTKESVLFHDSMDENENWQKQSILDFQESEPYYICVIKIMKSFRKINRMS